MRSILCCVALWSFVVACAAEPEPEPTPRLMSVRLRTPTPIGQGRYRVEAGIFNFDPSANVRGQVTVSGQTFVLDAVQDLRIVVDTDALEPFRTAQVTISLSADTQLGTFQDIVTWVTGPPDIAMVSPTVGDSGTMTVTGFGLGEVAGMRLGIRATPDASEVPVSLSNLQKVDETTYSAVVPVLLSTVDERTFPGKVPPASVYLVYLRDGLVDVPAGTTQLAYRSSKPNPTSGVAGSTFEISLFHPARAPDLAGVTVLFDDTALVPLSVQELGDITAGGFIYLTRSQFRIPADAAVGLHRITAITSFGEVMISNGPDFMAVASAE